MPACNRSTEKPREPSFGLYVRESEKMDVCKNEQKLFPRRLIFWHGRVSSTFEPWEQLYEV